MKSLFRSVFKKLHVWVGLSFGILFCLMGLSGSVIVFRYQIEDALRPKWQAKAPAPGIPVVNAAVANTQKRWPDAEISRIEFPAEAGQPLRLLLVADKKPLRVFCDGKTGEVFGTFDLPWLDTILDFHTNLFKIPSGRQWTGVIGLGLFLVSLSGMAIWLMRRPDWSDFGSVTWGGPWKRVNFELHRSTGLIMNGFLVFLAFTGMWMAYPNTFRSAVETLSGSAAPKVPKLKVKSGDLAKPMDAYVQAALSAFPAGKVREFRLPLGKRAPISARMWNPGDFRPDGSSYVTIDPGTARVLVADDSAKWSFTQRIVMGAKPVHYGEWGGLPLRALWFLIGLAPSLLFVSGLLVWSGRWLPARFRAPKKQLEEEGVLASVG